MPTESPWRLRDFRTLFTATALSQLGTSIGYLAIPLVAVSALDASPGQVGLLATLSTAAFLVIGLPAGAWVDRLRHRRVLIAADLTRAALFASVPVAWALDALTLHQLYAVVLLNGGATVFFDVASQSFLPQLVGPDGLVRANAAVVGLQAAGNVAGRGAGGVLVQLLTAPLAVVGVGACYLASALRLTGIRRTPTPPADPGRRPARLGAQIAEGLRHVLRDRELRALALTASLTNLGSQLINTLLPVLFTRELGLSAGVLGAYGAVGGVGIFLGARCAHPAARRLGYGRALSLAGACLAPAALLIPLIGRGPWLWAAGAGWLLATFKIGLDNVLGVSLRQRLTPDPLLGRMNATFRFMLTGAIAIGSAAAGLIGQFAGVRPALWVGGCLLALAFLPVFLSPVRTRRELPQQAGLPPHHDSRPLVKE
ncbi:major facilitator superfamily MFS_1 [Streptomyces bingchenggensis BCW-1]|uniref:Major facilitator superfamily MFS_1 n=1 Tax=Streptomyces bingchenggensis (strain BCW-1) TaxID=749414 RepID=D7CE03_STRBB|nr:MULTISPECIES: MFS transporter [Streptomyces]ADI06690.1 major facilitator superfamily MFS_1 [Streptomyces bingchenggensis BCW-1]